MRRQSAFLDPTLQPPDVHEPDLDRHARQPQRLGRGCAMLTSQMTDQPTVFGYGDTDVALGAVKHVRTDAMVRAEVLAQTAHLPPRNDAVVAQARDQVDAIAEIGVDLFGSREDNAVAGHWPPLGG